MAEVQVTVRAGRGKWLYWIDSAQQTVVADKVCQPTSPHFAGMAGQEITVTPCETQLHTEGFHPERSPSIWENEPDD